MIAGGAPSMDLVEVISIDPDNYPVPKCLQNVAKLPFRALAIAGAMMEQSKN